MLKASEIDLMTEIEIYQRVSNALKRLEEHGHKYEFRDGYISVNNGDVRLYTWGEIFAFINGWEDGNNAARLTSDNGG